jgi:tetratricopeptide (TPR) repeat protein
MTKTLIARLLCAAALTIATNHSFADDYGSLSPGGAPDPLAGARAQIAEKKWARAIEELKKVNDTGNADWNNLMGYTLRKATPPDYAASEKYYNEALRINPRHRGALEYSGELYLMLGDLPKAEQRLAALDKICWLGCPEYSALKEAVQSFKANGNKSVSAQ